MPEVEVEVFPVPADGGKAQAVVKDTQAQRAWSGEGDTMSQAATEAMRKFLGDRRAGEYVG